MLSRRGESNRATEPHRSRRNRSGAGRTSHICQLAIPLCLTSSAARTACLCSQHNLGLALRRTRRFDGVEVDRSLPRDAVLALRNATTPTAPVRDRLGTARGPRGCSRRPGARRRRRRIGWRPPRRREPWRPLSGAVLDVSPVASRKRLRRSRNAPEIQKETTQRHHSRRRVASTA